jgi:hypothetical protein
MARFDVQVILRVKADAVLLAQFLRDMCKRFSQMVEVVRVIRACTAFFSQQFQVAARAGISGLQRLALAGYQLSVRTRTRGGRFRHQVVIRVVLNRVNECV